jgi:Zn-dependent peptidase ImmA (M78 family)/DNA-binding XRE family transcriptional regulator
MDEDVLRSTDSRLMGRRLHEARTARGLTQQEAADLLGVARTTITAIEKGERRIRPDELVRLAGFYGRSLGELLRPGEPTVALVVQLRSALSSHPGMEEEIGPQLLEFQRLCEDYLELERLCGAPLPKRYPIPYESDSIPAEQAAEDVATAERNRLGLGDGPAPDIRDLLETDVGLRIFSLDLPPRISGLYVFSEPFGGCIAVNRSHSEERKRLSLLHGFGHFLTQRHRPEVTVSGKPERPSRSERFAEAFANAFLMPAAGLARRFNELYRSRGGRLTPADLCRLAHVYIVSPEAMTLRLERLKLLPAGTWQRIEPSGLTAPSPSHDLGLPIRYLFLATEAFDRGDLSEGQFARFLRLDRLEARRLFEQLSPRPATAEVDLGQPLRLPGAA